MAASSRRITIDIAPAHHDLLERFQALLGAGRGDDVQTALSSLDASAPPLGPFRSRQAALDFLTARMVAATKPLSIWLFGSKARGRHTSYQAFTFLAIFPDEDPASIDHLQDQLADAVMASGVNVTVFACSASDFVAFKDTAGSQIRTVHEEGREVYRTRKRHADHTDS